MRLLVTGAAGFVGSELLRQASAGAGHEVTAVAREVPNGASGGEGVSWVAADLSRPGFEAALPDRIDAVVHLAQSRRYRDFPEGASDVIAVNVAGTAALLDHARSAGAGSFVLASTATVYEPSRAPLREDSPLDCSAIYPASKRAAELLLEPYSEELSCWALRIFTAYGPHQRRMLIADLIDRVRTGRAVELQGEDGIPMSPIHVSDVARGLLAAATAEEGPEVRVLNLGGGESLTLREIAERIGMAMGSEPVFERVAEEPPSGWIADRTRFSAAFPELESPVPFAKGIASTVGDSVAAER